MTILGVVIFQSHFIAFKRSEYLRKVFLSFLTTDSETLYQIEEETEYYIGSTLTFIEINEIQLHSKFDGDSESLVKNILSPNIWPLKMWLKYSKNWSNWN